MSQFKKSKALTIHEDLSRSGSMSSLAEKSKSMNDLSRLGVGGGGHRSRKNSESIPRPKISTLSASGSASPRPLRKARSAATFESVKVDQGTKAPPPSTSHTPVKKSSLAGVGSVGSEKEDLPPRPASSLEGGVSVHIPAPSFTGGTSSLSTPQHTPNQQASPSLSRRQKLIAKATEKGTQVATKWQVGQKWQMGKATVKGFWNKHRGGGGDEAEAQDSDFEEISMPVPDPEPTPAHVPSSKSEESKLSMRVVGTGSQPAKMPPPELKVNGGEGESAEGEEAGKSPVVRKRSHSEPDTVAHNAKDGSDQQQKASVVSQLNQPDAASIASRPSTATLGDVFPLGDTDSLDTGLAPPFGSVQSPDAATSPDDGGTPGEVPKRKERKYRPLAHKRTSVLPLKPEVSWHQNLELPLTERTKYLSVAVWSCGDRESEKMLLGWVDVGVPEVLDDCAATISNFHQQTYSLRPPEEANASALQKFPKLSRLPGFDSRLCHGDVTVSFHWHPDRTYEESRPGSKLESPLASHRVSTTSVTDTTARRPTTHRWENTHFQQAVFCAFCQRKIWLKTASQCLDCLLICHKKCQPKAEDAMSCGGVPRPIPLDADKEEEPIETGEEAVECEEKGGGRVGKTRRLGMALSEKISYLRRRKPHGQQGAPGTDSPDLSANRRSFPDDADSLKDQPAGAEVEDEAFHNLLYTKGGTYNEQVINAAKDLGKDLFSELPPEQRKGKINQQVDKLQQEIDQVTRERLELLQRPKTPASAAEVKEKIAKLDDKLQHCIDLEEGKPDGGKEADSLSLQSSGSAKSVPPLEKGPLQTPTRESGEEETMVTPEEAFSISSLGSSELDSPFGSAEVEGGSATPEGSRKSSSDPSETEVVEGAGVSGEERKKSPSETHNQNLLDKLAQLDGSVILDS